jgi:hypothetical protein
MQQQTPGRVNRRSIRAGLVGAAVAALPVAALLIVAPSASAATPIALVLPQGDAFAVLGYSCGGIKEHAYATGFDPSGNAAGDVSLSTTCSSGGRGSRPSVHTGWAAVSWDLSGNVVSYGKPTSPVSVSTTFSTTDKYGDQLYNTSSGAFLLPSGKAPIKFSPALSSSGTVGTSYSSTFAPASGGSGSFSYSASGLPGGLSLSGTTISGTPTTAGTYKVTVTATDTVGGSNNAASLTITIATPPPPPED